MDGLISGGDLKPGGLKVGFYGISPETWINMFTMGRYRIRRIPRVTTLTTFSFSSRPWMTLLWNRGPEVLFANVKRKEISMTQLNILESRASFTVLLLHGAIFPPSF